MEVDEMVVVGHFACRGCGDWVIDVAPTAKMGVCQACCDRLNDAARNARLRFEIEGTEVESAPLPLTPKIQPRAEVKAKSHRAWNRARSRAMTRLIHIYRPMWDLLLAEEKAKLGISPRVRRQPPKLRQVHASLLADIADADERAGLRRGA